MDDKTYTVTGMTCAHCVLSVREEVGDVAVAAAVNEAGYEVSR